MPYNVNNEGKVHEIAKLIRALNRLGEDKFYVRYGSWHEIVYAGDINKLILPSGYHVSEYRERGKTYTSITNEGYTGNNSYWVFVVSPR